jgi:hypothetical protein
MIVAIVVPLIAVIIVLIVLATVPLVPASLDTSSSCGGALPVYTHNFPSGSQVTVTWNTVANTTPVTLAIYSANIFSPVLYSQTATNGSTSFQSSGQLLVFTCSTTGFGSSTENVHLHFDYKSPLL